MPFDITKIVDDVGEVFTISGVSRTYDARGEATETYTSHVMSGVVQVMDGSEEEVQEGILSKGDIIVFVSECLTYDNKVMTDKGELPIGKIVEEELPVKVLSYDFNSKKVVWRKIVSYSKRLNPNIGMVNIGSLRCTANHPIFSDGKWLSANQLSFESNLFKLIVTKKRYDTKTERRRTTNNFGWFAWRRTYSKIKTKTKELLHSFWTRNKAEGLFRVEIQKVKEIGYNKTKGLPKQRIWKGGIYNNISYSLSSHLQSVPENVLFRKKKNSYKSNFRKVKTSWFSCLDWRRWLFWNGVQNCYKWIQQRISQQYFRLFSETRNLSLFNASSQSQNSSGNTLFSLERKKQVVEYDGESTSEKHGLQMELSSKDDSLSNMQSRFFTEVQSPKSLQEMQMEMEISDICKKDSKLSKSKISKIPEAVYAKEKAETFVYDIGVKDTHWFFAERVLVHNSEPEIAQLKLDNYLNVSTITSGIFRIANVIHNSGHYEVHGNKILDTTP